MENTKFINFLNRCIPWFSTALACLLNGGGFHESKFPQLKDINRNFVSNYINEEYRCDNLILDGFEITQSNKEILEIAFEINQSRDTIESKFFDRRPDIMLNYEYSITTNDDSVQQNSLIWIYSDYKIALRNILGKCKVSVSRKT